MRRRHRALVDGWGLIWEREAEFEKEGRRKSAGLATKKRVFVTIHPRHSRNDAHHGCIGDAAKCGGHDGIRAHHEPGKLARAAKWGHSWLL